MAPQTTKHAKISTSAGLTTLLRTGSDVVTHSHSNSNSNSNSLPVSVSSYRISYKSPVTLKNVFDRPHEDQVKIFYHARNFSGVPYDRLPDAEKLAWTESLHDNSCLMGYLVYSQMLPCAAETRTKLNSGSAHWNELNASTDRVRLEQRRAAYDRLRRNGSAFSAFHGLPYNVDMAKNVLEFLGVAFEPSDVRHRFFMSREFAMTSSEHGKVNSSSVYISCSKALALLYFAVVIMGRPCCLESVILPISVKERSVLEQTWGCPGQHLDGPIKKFQTNWREVFRTLGTPHRNINYVCLEKVTEDGYIGGKHVSDCYALYHATRAAPGDAKTITAKVNHYRLNSKIGVESGAVVYVFDVLREKPVEAVGNIDGSVLGAITSTYGQMASLDVQSKCLRLRAGAHHSLFDSSVSNKLREIINHTDMVLWKARKRLKVELKVHANLDPADMNKKISKGKMLDPCDPVSSEKMHAMLQGLCGAVWRPLTSLIGEALGTSMEHPSAFLRITDKEADHLYEHAKRKGMEYADVSNLNMLLVLSNSFQRSQVLREATLNEFGISPDGTHYKHTLKRPFKTAGASRGTLPVRHFNLSPGQSMMIHFLVTIGHRFCDVDVCREDKRRLLLNSKGQAWVHNDIVSRCKIIGTHWLGLANFCIHTCRTFFATAALNSGQVSPSNLEDFGSFLQVSTSTLRSSYMSASANSAAHKIGNDVLGGVVNSACTGVMSKRVVAPYGKKLNAVRMEFIDDIRGSLHKYGGDVRLMFRDLVKKRKVGQLGEGEKWFRSENTFFEDEGETSFKKFRKTAGL